MGSAMATNLHKHLVKEGQEPLSIYNRTSSRGAPLVELGALQRGSVNELVEQCDVIFLSVSDDEALLSTVDQICAVENLNGKTFIDTTTVHPNTTRKAAANLAERGASFLAGMSYHLRTITTGSLVVR